MTCIPTRRCAEVDFVDAAPLMTIGIGASWLSFMVCFRSFLSCWWQQENNMPSSLAFSHEHDDRPGTSDSRFSDFRFIQSFSEEEYM